MSPLLAHRVDADSSPQWLIPDSKCLTANLAQERRLDLLPLAAVQGLPESEKNPVRAETNFTRKFNADSPVQSTGEKYLTFVFQKYVVVLRRPALTRRGGRVVTNVERGMRWTR
jgi:hypothetical protein